MSSDHVDVSVILPVFNEVGHIEEEFARIIAAFDASEFSYELIVIDDGSTDGSHEVLAKRDDIRLITFTRNQGSGSARRVGTEAARGDIVVWTDVDMSYPNDQMPDLVRAMAGHDQVVGARRTEEGTVKILRTPAKWLIRRLAQVLSGTEIPDLNSGFRAFRRDVALQYLHLLPTGFSCVTTITMTFLNNGYDVAYMPIDYATRAGESKFHWYADTRRYALQVVRMVLLYNPLKVLGPIGLALMALGFGKVVYDSISDPISIAINTLVILLMAMLVLLIGLLGDLIVQVNRKPGRVPPAAVIIGDARSAER